MTPQQLDSTVCHNLRFPLALMVVFIHSFGLPSSLEAPCFWDWSSISGIYVYNSLRIIISHVLTHVAVPTFYLISGYFFFYGLKDWNKEIYFDKLQKRWHTLFIPYLAWITIAILFEIVSLLCGVFLHGKPITRVLEFVNSNGGVLHMYWDCYVWNVNNTNWIGSPAISSAPFLVPMWFIRDLIVIVVLSPLIHLAVSKLKMWALLLFAFVYITKIWIPFPGFSPSALLFFGIGSYISINNKSISEIATKRWVKLVVMISALLLPVMFWFDGHNTSVGERLYPIFVISSVISTLYISVFYARKNCELDKMTFLSRMSDYTFFIYATHTIFGLWFTGIILSKLFGYNIQFIETHSTIAAIIYLINPFFAVVICICIYHIINKLLPKPLMRILNGGR